MFIVKPFTIHGDDHTYQAGDEKRLVASGANLTPLWQLGYLKDRKAGDRHARVSWKDMKEKARQLDIAGYSRLTRDKLMEAIKAKEPSYVG